MSVFLILTSLALAAACFAIRELAAHGKLNYKGPADSFWGEQSWLRKYSDGLIQAPKNWYYRVFKIPYKEKFPLSATALVFVTDGYHLLGFLMQIFICFSVSGGDWHLFGAALLIWSLYFNVLYTVFNRS